VRRPTDRRRDEPGPRLRAGARRELLALVHLDLLRGTGGRRGRRRPALRAALPPRAA
jgi:hypothetical protein